MSAIYKMQACYELVRKIIHGILELCEHVTHFGR
jgi:hypothetical protein